MPHATPAKRLTRSSRPTSPASAGRGATSIRPRWTCLRRPCRTFGSKAARAPAEGGGRMAEHDLHAVAFPKLAEAQLVALSRCSLTRLRRFHAGETLFAACDRDPRFFVVKAGEVEIVDVSGEKPQTITVHGPGQVTRDGGQGAGRPALLSARARTHR